jgi:hypothetical protein
MSKQTTVRISEEELKLIEKVKEKSEKTLTGVEIPTSSIVTAAIKSYCNKVLKSTEQ